MRLVPPPERYQGDMKRLLTLVAVPAVLLAGCSGGTTTPTAGPTTTAAPPAATETTGESPDPSPSEKPTTSNAVARCHSQDLALKLGDGDGAAGTSRVNLLFTNKSAHKCMLYGYPGVSWVTGADGTQVNDPFSREKGTKKTVTLAPGGVAHAILQQHAAGNYDAAKCKPVTTRGFRVYPPDETASIFLSSPGTECSAKGVNLGQVFVIETGTGGVA